MRREGGGAMVMVSPCWARRRSSSAKVSHCWTLRRTTSGALIQHSAFQPRRPRDLPGDMAIPLELLAGHHQDIPRESATAQGTVHGDLQRPSAALDRTDDQEIHIAARIGRTPGMRTEENHPLRVKSVHQNLD